MIPLLVNVSAYIIHLVNIEWNNIEIFFDCLEKNDLLVSQLLSRKTSYNLAAFTKTFLKRLNINFYDV